MLVFSSCVCFPLHTLCRQHICENIYSATILDHLLPHFALFSLHSLFLSHLHAFSSPDTLCFISHISWNLHLSCHGPLSPLLHDPSLPSLSPPVLYSCRCRESRKLLQPLAQLQRVQHRPGYQRGDHHAAVWRVLRSQRWCRAYPLSVGGHQPRRGPAHPDVHCHWWGWEDGGTSGDRSQW